ncbi:substrate-binding periplasmic protein [Sulfitobacter sp. EhC04]|uniref:substrate-binding periplasmic protein n=1 Tax=Sulfitobacter sp. EhC04 TaxID=1849168 RepID=UPI001F3A9E43|nr:transporter substrate-binding domain-containing protein [Sulfitobacter sp. EhC04]
MLREITAAALLMVSPLWVAASSAETNDDVLRACLPRNAGVLAGRRLTGGSGFDFRVAQEIATSMGKTLEPVWYENELDEESNPLSETYAMLGFGLCDIVPGHPRLVSAVGVPDYERAVLPRWLGMPREMSLETGMLSQRLVGYVDVSPIDVSDGYMRTQVGMVYREGTPEPTGPSDLAGRRLALQENTLSGTIAMLRTKPGERGNLVTMSPGTEFLWNVEKEGLDLAMVDVLAFDSYLKANPFTQLRLADWRHSIGLDIGIAVLSENPDLPQLNEAISELLALGRFVELAQEVGLTYLAPQDTELSKGITMQMLMVAE